MKFTKIALFLLIILAGLKVHAQTSDELKQKREKYNQELEELNREYEETANNKKSSLKQLNLLRRQIDIREQKINSINSEVRQLDNQISEDNTSVHNLQSQLGQLKKEYAAMIQFAYRNRNSYNKLEFIFGAKDFNQAYKRMKYLQEFAGYRERQAQYIEGTEKDLNNKITSLDNTKKEKNNALADQVKEKVTLNKQKKDETRVVADLSKQQGQLAQQQRDLQRKINKINQEIRDAIRREIAKKRAEAEKANNAAANGPVKHVDNRSSDNTVLTATPEDAKLSADFMSNRGHLPWPVANGEITTHMGRNKFQGITTENDGIEIKTNENAPVRVIFDGKVQAVENVYGAYLVIVNHGAYFTAYSNLKSVSVSKGQKLTTKQLIGTAANDSTTGDPTVSFSVYKGTEPVNPETWLKPE
ncbi:MAG: peptidoglycan DD-metalloendopeptidase family protein [Bacteroidetes bacterium]|nr:peptidoglycan DD-metalloendopeptidase family protein [Bacteroidota bacterium]